MVELHLQRIPPKMSDSVHAIMWAAGHVSPSAWWEGEDEPAEDVHGAIMVLLVIAQNMGDVGQTRALHQDYSRVIIPGGKADREAGTSRLRKRDSER